MNFAEGHIIGGTYRVERLLGQGGKALVYLVSHLRMPKRFALKLIDIPVGGSEHKTFFLARFQQEVEALAQLASLHIVDVVDWGDTNDGALYAVMEYLQGEDLATFLSRTGALQLDVALAIALQVGRALQAAHSVGIVPANLKPSNIFISRGDVLPKSVKVLDFWSDTLCRAYGQLSPRPDVLWCTPDYVSPEQAAGARHKIDERSNQFTLAVVIYEMLTGVRPFSPNPCSDSLVTLSNVVLHTPPPVPFPRVGQALARAMSKNPDHRFPSMDSFLIALGATKHSIVVNPHNVASSISWNMSEGVHGQDPAREYKKPQHHGTLFKIGAVAAIFVTLFASGLLSNYAFPVRWWQYVTAGTPSPQEVVSHISVLAPKSMYVSREYPVVVRAMHGSDSLGLLTEELPTDDTRLLALLLSKKVEIDLKPESFDDFDVIYEYSARQQVVTTSAFGATEWRWKVVPKRPGEKKILRLIIANILQSDTGHEDPRTLPYRRAQTIEVAVLVHPVEQKHFRQFAWVIVSASTGIGFLYFLINRVRPRRRARSNSADSNVKQITRAQLRQLLDDILPTASDFDAFCLDEYPDIYREFSPGMERTAKTNLLLYAADLAILSDKLGKINRSDGNLATIA